MTKGVDQRTWSTSEQILAGLEERRFSRHRLGQIMAVSSGSKSKISAKDPFQIQKQQKDEMSLYKRTSSIINMQEFPAKAGKVGQSSATRTINPIWLIFKSGV